MEGASGMNQYAEAEEVAVIPETSVKESGLYLEISFPLKQTIESSEKYQKKYKFTSFHYRKKLYELDYILMLKKIKHSQCLKREKNV